MLTLMDLSSYNLNCVKTYIYFSYQSFWPKANSPKNIVVTYVAITLFLNKVIFLEATDEFDPIGSSI